MQWAETVKSKKVRKDPLETALLDPVEAHFNSKEYLHYHEVPLGWRRIDLVCVGVDYEPWIAVELKVSDWWGALKQASLNHLIADRSYVALWHRSVHRAMERRDLFEHYRVGLIEVGPGGAKELLRFMDTPPSILRLRQRELSLAKFDSQRDERRFNDATIPILST